MKNQQMLSPLVAIMAIAFAATAVSGDVVSDFQFNTASDLEGWTALANISGSLTADGDSLNGTASSGDPRIARLSLNASTTEDWQSVIFRVRETEPTNGPFFVTTFDPTGLNIVFNGVAGTFGGGTVISSTEFSAVDSGDGFFTVTADISSFGSTTINQIRLDPIGAPDAGGNLFEVDFIQITNSATTIPEPTSLAVLGLGTVALFIRRRRR